jgi:hypothetical protein
MRLNFAEIEAGWPRSRRDGRFVINGARLVGSKAAEGEAVLKRPRQSRPPSVPSRSDANRPLEA